MPPSDGEQKRAEEVLQSPPLAPEPRSRPDLALVARTVGRYGTIIGLILLSAFFAIRSDVFLTTDNLLNILNASAVNGIIATGLTVTLVLFDFDLSIAAVANLAGMYAAGLSVDHGVTVGFLLAIGVGILIGALNGIVVTFFNISAFIATLGASLVIQGVIYGYTGGSQIVIGLPDNFTTLGIGSFLGIHYLVWTMLLVMLVTWTMLTHTPLGRQMYAIGGNPVAARLSGINVRRVRIIAFAICGTTAALGGVLLASNLGAGQPAAASGYLFDAFTACFIGAATMRDGEFHVLGTLVGVLILGVLANGLILVGVGPSWQIAIKGLFLIGAVALSGLLRRRVAVA
jgi:ribose transport system permease protein